MQMAKHEIRQRQAKGHLTPELVYDLIYRATLDERLASDEHAKAVFRELDQKKKLT